MHDGLSSSGRGSFPRTKYGHGNAAEKLLKSVLNCCGERCRNVVEKLRECCWKTVDEIGRRYQPPLNPHSRRFA
jgi:hypothetical protein